MGRLRESAPAPAPRRRRRLRRLALGAGGLATALLVVVPAGSLWLRGQLLASLPDLDGEAAVAGLSAPVTIERDRLGVPTVRGADRLDVARGLGFLHAQDRFFQMDLMLRRRAAGETAALVGGRGLDRDRRVRVHQFRRRAARALAALPADQRALLDAYAEGVGAGLAALAEPPFEYQLLFADPEPWRPEDSLLALYAMFLELQEYTIDLEDNLGFMHALLEPEVYELLTPLGSAWDSPMVGPAYTTSEFDVVAGRAPAEGAVDAGAGEAEAAGALPARAATGALPATGDAVAGSNAWALAPRHTASGDALLANDMHLPLSVPGIWYRASLRWPAADGGEHRVDGVTLPGLPLVVAGSNGRVAWGLTSSLIDTSDLVLLEIDPARPDHYRTPAGPRPFVIERETVEVRGGDPVELEVRLTEWGPALADDRLGRPRALAWLAHLDGAVDLGALGLETAGSVEEALAVARASGAPPQNVVLADAAGHIAWTILGRVPARRGFTGRLPESWADGSRGWDGLLPPAEVPAIVDPPSGMVWNGNNRSVDGEAYARLGDGGYRSGARALQIHQDLLALERATEADMLAIQRDHRALFFERWHRLLTTEVLTPEAVAAEPRYAAFRDAVARWDGAASLDSVSFGLVRTYRLLLAQEIFDGLTRELREIDPAFGLLRYPYYEEPLWYLVTERPEHLLDPRHPSWHAQLLAGVDLTIDWLARHGGGRPLAETTWGSLNVLEVRHPLSRAVPGLGRWLDMPAVPLPGAEEMPLAQRPDYGASVRMVVAPGREERGYLHIPMGQSGNPLSPHYADSFPVWAGGGEPTPLLPGPAEHRLTLLPAAPGAAGARHP